MENLTVYLDQLTLTDLAKWQPAENLTDITLFWSNGPFFKEVIPVFKRWGQLRRLTLQNHQNISGRPLELLGDFIMAMKHLSHLHLVIRYDYSNDGPLEILRDKLNEFILPQRPNFKLVISKY